MSRTITIIVFFFLLLIHVDAFCQCRLDKSGWKIVFNEEFDEKTVYDLLYNNTKAYSIIPSLTPWRNGAPNNLTWGNKVAGCTEKIFDQCNTEDEIQIFPNNLNGSGSVNFGITYNGAPTTNCIYDITSSNISSTHNDFINEAGWGYVWGMFEVRCKLSPDQYTYPAFWLCGVNAWPPEIDAFEHHGGDPDFFSTVHYLQNGTNTGCANTYNFNTFSLSQEYHTYTIVWTPRAITWFFDGKELKTDTDPTHLPGQNQTGYNYFFWNRMVMEIGQCLQCYNRHENKTFKPLEVDYVRVYRPRSYQPYNYATDNWDSYYNNQLQLYAQTSYKSSTDWVSDVIQPVGYYTDEVDGNLQGFQGGGKYMYRGASNYLWSTYWNSGNFYNYPVDQTHIIDGDIALADNGNKTYYRRNNSLWFVVNSVYTNVASINDLKSEIVPDINNSVSLYYINTLNSISKAVILGGGSIVNVVSPTDVKSDIVTDPSNFDKIFYINNSNNVEFINTTNSSVSIITSTNNVGSELAITPSGNELFFVSTSGTLMHTIKNPITNVWGTPTNFLAIPVGGSTPTIVNNIQKDLVISPDPNNLGIMWVGTDNRPWGAYFNGTNYSATFMDWNLPNVAGDFHLIKFGQAPNTIHIAYRGTDKKIRTMEWLPCEVLNPTCNTSKLMRTSNRPVLEEPITNIDQNDIEQVKLQPTISTGDYTLSFSNGYSSNYKMQIENTQGQIITHNNIANPITNIDLGDYPSGLYIVRVLNGKSCKVFKIIKL